MPSTRPLAQIADFRKAFHTSIQGRRDATEDSRSGSIYDFIAGPSAMLMAREAAFIRDTFRAIYFGVAEGQDLDDLIEGRYNIARIRDGYGTGTATLARPTAAGGGGVLHEGDRILVRTPGPNPVAYAVAADTPIAAGALYVAGLPIRATSYGAGTATNTQTTGQPAVFSDPIYDNTWQVTALQCANGTVFEKAADYRARVLLELQEIEVGYPTSMALACNALGAANVAIFGANYGGGDLHACATYVGDAGWNASAELVPACTVGLEGWRMLGPDMLVGPMVATALPFAATIQLYDDPALFDEDTITAACESAILRVFGDTGAYGYDLDAIFGAIVEVSPAIQDVTFTTPTSSVGLLTAYPPPSGVLWFPQTLARYQIPTNGIALTFTGPDA